MSEIDVFTITLGFVPARIWRQSAAAYAKTRNPDLRYRHYFVDQHYPLNKEKNRAELREICAEYGIEVLDPGRNLGLHEGFNWALRTINPPKHAVIIAYDPDVNPTTPGWDMALVRAIRGDSERKTVWSSLMHEMAEKELAQRGHKPYRKADGYLRLIPVRTSIMNSISAFSNEWLTRTGGLHEPTNYYGHLEAAMWARLEGKDWVFLPDYTENEDFRHQQDEEYKVYKWVHAHLDSWKGDFESWLAAGQPR